MLTHEQAKLVLKEAMKTGGDFAEIFLEDTIVNNISMLKDKINNSTTTNIHGAGIRILKDLDEVYGYTNDTRLESLVNLAQKLSSSFEGEPFNKEIDFKETVKPNIINIKHHPKDVSKLEKISYLKRGYDAIKDYSNEIVQVQQSIQDKNQLVTIINSDGKFVSDERCNIRYMVVAVASDGKDMQRSHNDIGGNCGYEIIENADIEALAIDAAKTAITMLHAEDMVGGKIPVIIHNGFGGVILHEACGHALEASSVSQGVSVFTNEYNNMIASPLVTAVDDGTLVNEWGSENVDDEGNVQQRRVLIDKGRLNSYMIDLKSDRKMKMGITSNSRRQSYKYCPTSRMTNTYILNGESTFEEIISNTKYALFAKSMGGGSVNPTTGEFNFAVNEGYMVIDGKIAYPVKGATLIGNGKDALKYVDMVANNLKLAYGMCGASSGSIPTCVGQPTIRISEMTVGGKGVK